MPFAHIRTNWHDEGVMPTIRKTKTASGATAVQVIVYRNGKAHILKHIGSAHTETDVAALMERARTYLDAYMREIQTALFTKSQRVPRFLSVEHAVVVSIQYRFAREFLLACARACGLDTINEPLLFDLALMRIIEPASKRRTLELLMRYFGVSYGKSAAYAALRAFGDKKEHIERCAFSFAKHTLKDPFALVLYDVTTLYFETFKADDLRIQGFSKDNKSNQPQIIIGLLVTASGFPVAWEVFKGNMFEGHTMLPVLKHFAETNHVPLPIVVADAAMLSKTNTSLLRSEGVSYIVGARLANTSPVFIQNISHSLNRTDGETIRLTHRSEMVVCAFSEKRHKKDKREMEKQIARARMLITRQESGRRVKFVKKAAKNSVAFDEELREKAERLLGIKGYVTNIPEAELSNINVISFYHRLWQVEQSFRMSKNDLEARPIFHRLEDSVRAHVLICFVALMMGKYLEIETGLSLRKVRDELWEMSEATVKDTSTDELFTIQSSSERMIGSALEPLARKWKLIR